MLLIRDNSSSVRGLYNIWTERSICSWFCQYNTLSVFMTRQHSVVFLIKKPLWGIRRFLLEITLFPVHTKYDVFLCCSLHRGMSMRDMLLIKFPILHNDLITTEIELEELFVWVKKENLFLYHFLCRRYFSVLPCVSQHCEPKYRGFFACFSIAQLYT